jgi:predicted ATPase/DNA-binding SARP family transcriptional activator
VAAFPDSRLRVAVLGTVLVDDGSGALHEPSGTTGKNLIAALVLAPAGLSVRSLVDDIWGDTRPRNEKAALQTLVSRARQGTADGLLESTPAGYRLAIDPDECDLHRARRLCDDAQRALDSGQVARAVEASTEALTLWRGSAGDDLGEAELAAALARTAQQLHDRLLRLRAAARLDQGDHESALADLTPLLEADPLDETLQLMRLKAIAGAGRPGDAIAAFARFRGLLRDELGTGPSPELVEFNAHLLRESDRPTERAGAVQIGVRAAPNDLIGRDDDIAAIESLLATSRLTTILGAGGLGKTRLAHEIAARATHSWPAVIVVELAGARDADDVPLVLATALGIREFSGSRLKAGDPVIRLDVRSRILAALSERPTLLVMDNCEHLIEAVAQWSGDIIAAAREVRVLTTSRSPLMIPAEHVYALEPLSSTPTDHTPPPAVSLFLERARAARPSVVLDTAVVSRLCDRLDGMPLAIELAAARVRSMSVDEIERRIGNRFALLRGGDRTAPERHRTLLAVIDWSWNLLTGSERRTLRRLSRFTGGFSADAAERVAQDDSPESVLDDLEALVNQSLISVSESAHTGELRYRMLETVREFGDLMLNEAGETELVLERMQTWAASFSLAAAKTTNGPGQLDTFRRVTDEEDNLVAALRTALDDGRADVAVSVFSALGFHWSLRGAHSEVAAFAPRMMPVLATYDPPDALADATAATLLLVSATSMFADRRLGFRALSRLRKIMRSGRVTDPQTHAMGSLLMRLGDLSAAERLLAEQRASTVLTVATFAHLMSGQLAENQGRFDAALAFVIRAHELAGKTEDVWMQSTCALSLAQLYSENARPAETLEWIARAEEGLKALGATDDLRQLDWLRAVNQVSLGRIDGAREIFEFFAHADADTAGPDFNDLRAIGWTGLAELAIADGDIDEGLAHLKRGIGTFGSPASRTAPWKYGVMGSYLAAATQAGRGSADATVQVARELRSTIRVIGRLRRGFIDQPITGTALLGLAAWALGTPGADGLVPHTDDRAALRDEVGLRLLALADAMGSRQDFPSTRRAPVIERAASRLGEHVVRAALDAANALSADQREGAVEEAVRRLPIPAR